MSVGEVCGLPESGSAKARLYVVANERDCVCALDDVPARAGAQLVDALIVLRAGSVDMA
jgi:hypothetical protein